jgi:bacterioferritin-associated ferredoxin
MYVCICQAVTDREVGAVIASGAGTAEEVGNRCGAGTGCGTCLDRIEAMLAVPAGQPVG